MMPFLTHFIGITSSIRAQYGIDLPGSLHTNKIPVILGRYPLPKFFCRLNIVPLDMDNGTFNRSHTDVVEKVNLLVAASQHGGTSVAESHSTWTEMALFWSLFTGGSFIVDFLKNEILGFDENLTVALWYDLQQCVMLPLPPKRLCANGTRKRQHGRLWQNK